MDYQERNARDIELEADRIARKKKMSRGGLINQMTCNAKPLEDGLKRMARALQKMPPIPPPEMRMDG